MTYSFHLSPAFISCNASVQAGMTCHVHARQFECPVSAQQADTRFEYLVRYECAGPPFVGSRVEDGAVDECAVVVDRARCVWTRGWPNPWAALHDRVHQPTLCGHQVWVLSRFLRDYSAMSGSDNVIFIEKTSRNMSWMSLSAIGSHLSPSPDDCPSQAATALTDATRVGDSSSSCRRLGDITR